MSLGQTVYTVYPVSNYSFGNKASKAEKDATVQDRLLRLKRQYEKTKLVRRSVEAITLVFEHNTIHILLLQVGTSYFRLPGGKLKTDEDEVDGLRRKLSNLLSPPSEQLASRWDVGECVGVFYRPNFDAIFYPYLPPHITQPKEIRKVFIVALPDRALFAVPKNMRLIAVPIFDLYDNVPRYGPVISSIPHLLSRFQFLLFSAQASTPVAKGIAAKAPLSPAPVPAAATGTISGQKRKSEEEAGQVKAEEGEEEKRGEGGRKFKRQSTRVRD